LFSGRKVFPRRRFDPLVKAAAVKAYTLGLSLRQVAAFLGSIGFNVSRESVRRWFLKAGEILSGDDVKNRCTGRPTIYTDRGPWYIWPAKVLGIRHRGETLGMRNPIEQWFSKLKRRIRQFNIFFPTYNIKTTERWIRAWTALS